MVRKIIIFNSFVTEGQKTLRAGGVGDSKAKLLRAQLIEVERELRGNRTSDSARKKLENERRLLKRHLDAEMTPVMFNDERTTTLHPGQDGMGTPAEIAYGKGWQEHSGVNPYDDPTLAKEWDRGRQDAKTARKMRGNSFRGGVRGQGFKEPNVKPGKVNPGHTAGGGRQYDYRSERGYVAKFVDNKTGKTLARSEPFISEVSAKKWIADNTKALINKGHRNFKGAVELSFYDPAIAANDRKKKVDGEWS